MQTLKKKKKVKSDGHRIEAFVSYQQGSNVKDKN